MITQKHPLPRWDTDTHSVTESDRPDARILTPTLSNTFPSSISFLTAGIGGIVSSKLQRMHFYDLVTSAGEHLRVSAAHGETMFSPTFLRGFSVLWVMPPFPAV